jgi:hypothetical protein
MGRMTVQRERIALLGIATVAVVAGVTVGILASDRTSPCIDLFSGSATCQAQGTSVGSAVLMGVTTALAAGIAGLVVAGCMLSVLKLLQRSGTE